jgi:hypothetical protein
VNTRRLLPSPLLLACRAHSDPQRRHRVRVCGTRVGNTRPRDRPSGSEWDYVELTEVRTSTMPSGHVVAEIVLWNEPAGIRVIAEALSVEVGGQDIGSLA